MGSLGLGRHPGTDFIKQTGSMRGDWKTGSGAEPLETLGRGLHCEGSERAVWQGLEVFTGRKALGRGQGQTFRGGHGTGRGEPWALSSGSCSASVWGEAALFISDSLGFDLRKIWD